MRSWARQGDVRAQKVRVGRDVAAALVTNRVADGLPIVWLV